MALNRAPFNALIDDDGSNTIGTPWNKARIAGVVLDPTDAEIARLEALVGTGGGGGAAVVVPTALTGTQNNVVLPNERHVILRCENASALTITGFAVAGHQAGDIVEVVSWGVGHVFLTHADALSALPGRLGNIATSGATPLAAGRGTARYYYDTTSGYWKLVAHEQGTFITAPFVASDFFVDSAGTWVVEAGDVIIGYRLSGAQLAVLLSFATTTVTGAVTYLRIRPAQYGGFTLPNPGSQFSPGYVYDVGNVLALISNNSVATNLAFGRLDGAAFTAATNGVWARGTFTGTVT